MGDPTQQRFGGPARWAGNGPWRSKSVMAALLITFVGLLSWVSDIRSGQSTDRAPLTATNTPAATQTDVTDDVPAPESRWNWERPLPGYAKFSASYVAGCCAGWFFRRATRLILVVGGLIIALLGFVRCAGLDTGDAQDQVRRGRGWASQQIESATEALKHVLPSATGTGVGMFMGFWRRRKATAGERGA